MGHIDENATPPPTGEDGSFVVAVKKTLKEGELMARRGGRTRGEKVIDNVRWTFSSSNFDGQAAGTAAATVIGAGAQHAETILRTRGELIASIDGASAPGKLIRVGVGLALVPEGTGSTVTWSPLSDGDAPWYWFTVFHLGYEEMVTDVIDVPVLTGYREAIDSKAMRRLRPDVEVQLVMEQVTIATASALNLAVGFRTLLGS